MLSNRHYVDEERLISLLLYDLQANMPVISSVVTPTMLQNPEFKQIYTILLREFQKNKDIDIKRALAYNNVDIARIAELTDNFVYISEDEAETIARHVWENYRARQLIEQIEKVYTEVSESYDLETIKQEIGNLFVESNRGIDLESTYTLVNAFTEVLKEYELKEKIKKENPDAVFLSGDSTGYKTIDKWTYGLKEQEMWIIAGRPSMGKTALALQMAFKTVKQNKKPAMFFSLETSATNLSKRLVIINCQVSNSRISEGNLTPDEKTRMYDFIFRFSDLPLVFVDSGIVTPNTIRNNLIRYNERNEQAIRYVFIDYLQLLTPSKRAGNRQEEVSSISRELKLIAKEFNITIVALSQLSREVEKRPDKRPKMSDLRESGSIEQDADIILMLYRDEYYKSKDEKRQEAYQSLTEVIQAKFKEGPTGVYSLNFIPEFMLFTDYIPDIEGGM